MASENGWEPAKARQDQCEWIRVPGAEHVSLQILKGQPLQILRAFAADYHAYVEPLRDADSACRTETNSVPTSNHLNATGMDLNWNGADGKTFRLGITKERAFPGAQSRAVDELLDFYEGIMFNGGKWSIRDHMHWQLNGNTYNNPRTQDFINRKIRADGFSTYKRDGAPPAPAPVADGALVLSQAMGGSVSLEKYREYLPGFRDCVNRSGAATPKRINMMVAQLGHECVGFKYMREIWGPTQQQLTYQGRMGNNNPGDGERYMGRGAIMVTGKDNYRALSQWAHGKGYVRTPTFFVDDPAKLETPQYCFLGAIWYWTIARPKINEYCDWDNLEDSLVAVTKAINGGTYGLDDRRNRINRARSMDLAPIMRGGSQPPPTVPPTTGDDDMSAEDVARLERKLDILVREWGPDKVGPSRSFMATDGAGVTSPLGFLYNMDGNIWSQQLTWAYLFDVELATDVVETVARTGAYAGSWVQSESFNAWLNEFGQQYCQGLVAFKAALVSKLTSKSVAVATSVDAVPVTNVTNVVDTRALEAEIARLSDQFERLQVTINNPPTNGAEAVAGTTAQRIGNLVGAVKDGVELGLAMDQTERAALTAASRILQLENGSKA